MIQLYGASDDLIEVEGDVSEEWEYRNEDGALVFLSTGHVFRLTFRGDWTINLLDGDSSVVEWSKRSENTHDDLVRVHADVRWVGCDDRLERTSGTPGTSKYYVDLGQRYFDEEIAPGMRRAGVPEVELTSMLRRYLAAVDVNLVAQSEIVKHLTGKP